jgi:IPT/TIG domain
VTLTIRRKRVFRKVLAGVVTALATVGMLGPISSAFAQSPVPLINQPLVPETVPPGGPGFTLTVNGTGFAAGSAVEWNGNVLATQFVNQGRLTANIPALNIAKDGTASITVVNSGPGGGRSGSIFFPIGSASSTVTLNRTDFGPTEVWTFTLWPPISMAMAGLTWL